MGNIQKINPKRKVYKSNDFLEAIIKLDLVALKIITICASQINLQDRGEDKDFIEYTFTYKAMDEVLGIGERNYTRLKEITSGMITPIWVPTDEGLIQFALMEKAVYNDKKGTLTLQFSKEMKPFLLNLKKYHSYEVGNIIPLRSKHSYHIYELLKQYEGIKKRVVSLSELKRILVIEDKYERYADLRKWVLEPVQKEITAHTDITFDFQPIKTAKKITSIEFTIYTKDSADIIEIQPARTLNDEIQVLKDLFKECGLFLSQDNGEALLNKTKSISLSNNDWEQIATWLKTKQKQGKITKPVAYLLKDPESIIKNDILVQDNLFSNTSKNEYPIYISPDELAELELAAAKEKDA